MACGIVLNGLMNDGKIELVTIGRSKYQTLLSEEWGEIILKCLAGTPTRRLLSSKTEEQGTRFFPKADISSPGAQNVIDI